MFRRTLTTFPSSFFRRAPVVAGATACMGTSPNARDSDRPRPALFRKPAKAYGIPRIGVPSTVATAGEFPGIGLPLTPPTRSPHGWGQCAFDGHCKRSDMKHVATRRRSLRCDFERAGRLYNLVGGRCSPGPGGPAPGTDDPSAPTWLGLPGRRRELIALAVPDRPQRLDGFYDREPAAGCAANFMSGLCPTASGLATIKNRAQSLLLSTELSTARCASKTP